MSLPDLLAKYAEIIADELLNECVDDIDEAKFRVLRYHGHAIPDDMECSPHGILSVWWENLRPKNTTTPCPLFPVVTLNAKFVVCWKTADISPKSIKVHYTENDADAARLAHIAECVSRRLMSLVCLQANQVDADDDPLDHAFLVIADKPSFLGASPGGAQGGVAWINWRMEAGINNIPTAEPQMFFVTADDTLTAGDTP